MRHPGHFLDGMTRLTGDRVGCTETGVHRSGQAADRKICLAMSQWENHAGEPVSHFDRSGSDTSVTDGTRFI